MENAVRSEAKGQTSFANKLDQSTYEETSLSELRQELDRVAAQWATVIGEGVVHGGLVANETVQKRPWASVAMAVAIGAVVAIALVPPRRLNSSHRDDNDRVQTGLTKSHADRAVVAPQPLASRFMQAWDSIASLNASALPSMASSTAPSFDTLAALAKSFWAKSF